MTIEIIQGDCEVVMAGMADNSVDCVVCDPPYGLKFMNKSWDYEIPSVDIWRQCLRVLKPGGYLLSFAGTRTQHRMACNIEDAGFEIRDMIAWVYGMGFPKSLDISKAIDSHYFCEWLEANPDEKAKYNEQLLAAKGDNKATEQVRRKFRKAAGVEREVVGIDKHRKRPNLTEAKSIGGGWDKSDNGATITAPATDAARQWEGWGTALKPSWENITIAQKSLTGGSDIGIILRNIVTKYKEILCQCQLFAEIAEKNLRLSQSGSSVDVSIAQWIADENTNIQDDLSALTAMLQSRLATNSNWSTVLSWLHILADLYEKMNTHTTITETSLTIDLKTLELLEWENIFQNITQAKSSPTLGWSASALSAASLFNAVKLKLEVIQKHFAQECVMSKTAGRELLPSMEPITIARKPLSECTVAANVLKHGTGGINVDGCRVETDDSLNGGMTTGSTSASEGWDRPWRHNEEAVKAKMDRAKASVEKSERLGRFPANLIHDGSDEVVGLFPEQAGATGSRDKIGGCKFFHGEDKRKSAITRENDSGSAARFFYCAKSSKQDRDEGLEGMEIISPGQKTNRKEGSVGINAYAGSCAPMRNHHPTVKPTDLMRYLCRLVCPLGGTVLDPFAGSGSTGKGAVAEGFDFIGIEKDADYCEIARKRIEAEQSKMALFDNV